MTDLYTIKTPNGELLQNKIRPTEADAILIFLLDKGVRTTDRAWGRLEAEGYRVVKVKLVEME